MSRKKRNIERTESNPKQTPPPSTQDADEQDEQELDAISGSMCCDGAECRTKQRRLPTEDDELELLQCALCWVTLCYAYLGVLSLIRCLNPEPGTNEWDEGEGKYECAVCADTYCVRCVEGLHPPKKSDTKRMCSDSLRVHKYARKHSKRQSMVPMPRNFKKVLGDGTTAMYTTVTRAKKSGRKRRLSSKKINQLLE